MPPRTAIIALTKGGKQLARHLATLLPGSYVFPCQEGIYRTLKQAWQDCDNLICIMAAGIVVRGIAPLLHDKTVDPAVVICDEQGRFAVSLLSGHLGGGNALTEKVADLLGAQAVITTASDVLGRTALDLWCRDTGLVVTDKQGLTRVMTKLVNTGSISLYSEYPLPPLPSDIILSADSAAADLLITCRTERTEQKGRTVLLHPKALTVGIGCKRNTPSEEISEALDHAFRVHHLARASVRKLASIDLKSDEPGLLAFAGSQNLRLNFYSAEQLNQVEGTASSTAVLRATGAKAVAEPAAILSADKGTLLVQKMKFSNVTIAIAEIRQPFSCACSTE
mgnify:FL=1